MAIISKLDNEFTQLLKAQIVFFNNPQTKGTLSITLEGGDLSKYVVEKTLKRDLEDIKDLPLIMSEKLFLEQTGRLRKEFLKYIEKNRYLKAELIKDKEGVKEVRLTGNLVDLILAEYPVTTTVQEHVTINQDEVDGLILANLIPEAARRFQMKADFIRYDDHAKIYLGGCRDRITYDWHSIVVTTITGDLKDKVIGTNHLLTAFALNYPVEGYLDDKMWEKDWDKKDIALDWETSKDGWTGARINPDTTILWDTPPDFNILIDGSNMFDASHFAQHNRNKNIIIEWDKGLANDFGTSDIKKLKVVKKISAEQ